MALPALAGGQDGALHGVLSSQQASGDSGGDGHDSAINRSPAGRADGSTTASSEKYFFWLCLCALASPAEGWFGWQLSMSLTL
ncbi:hypothetical protein GTR04_7334 [Trichophyton interdigitale]|nr:hypothetical protein GY631_0699 [Trichophyton interdigitale]KAG5216754.1 hypothetical protein GY632_7238 [Trichophyton interdigitale]KAG8205285.1 hypothetical protein GTR04_7334 [Trichophyton interdigitale]